MSTASPFDRALPVWSDAWAGQMNVCLSFHARVGLAVDNHVMLRLAGAQIYRIWANGAMLGHGPARTAHGYARVDEWPVTCIGAETLELVIEVVGFGVPTFCSTHEPAFLCAELIIDGKPVAWTASQGGGFKAEHRRERLQKVERFSYQRAFVECYQLGPHGCDWHRPGYDPVRPLTLSRVHHRRRWLERGVPVPDLSLVRPRFNAMRGRSRNSLQRAGQATQHRFLIEVPDVSAGFPPKQVAWSLYHELAGLRFSDVDAMRLTRNRPVLLTRSQWLRVDFGKVHTGFPCLHITAQRRSRLLLVFDEILVNGQLVFDRSTCVNALGIALAAGAEVDFEAFEPYTLRYLQVLVVEGTIRVSRMGLRNLINAAQISSAPRGLRPAAVRIREAAVASYRQNALDIFMDCPSRERAGWLCDSLFTARAEWHLCRDNPIERAFLENYLRPVKFADLPDGMVPMCYPADVLQRQFIPNWAMFLIVQLDEAKRRRRLPSEWQPVITRRVRGLLRYFRRFENEVGLLEKLESWVFVEWSKANAFVQDVNFPTNMLYAATLRAAARLVDDPALKAKASRLETTIRRLAWRDGHFVDHAERGVDGQLVVAKEASEVCQYYAFTFGLASPRRYPELWHRLVRSQFGTLHPANAFVGKLLRLDLLITHGEPAAAQRELMRHFAPMARRTGTLWEHLDEQASCNHGFTSYIAVLIDRLDNARSKP